MSDRKPTIECAVHGIAGCECTPDLAQKPRTARRSKQQRARERMKSLGLSYRAALQHSRKSGDEGAKPSCDTPTVPTAVELADGLTALARALAKMKEARSEPLAALAAITEQHKRMFEPLAAIARITEPMRQLQAARARMFEQSPTLALISESFRRIRERNAAMFQPSRSMLLLRERMERLADLSRQRFTPRPRHWSRPALKK